MESLIQAVGFGIALPLVLWLSQRFVPYEPPPGVHPYMLHVLRPIYARWDTISAPSRSSALRLMETRVE